MSTSTDTVTCPSCGAEQPTTRAWCRECFAAFVEPLQPGAPTVGDALAGAAAATTPGGASGASPAAVSPAVHLAVSDLWAAQAPSRMPQILSLSVAICAVVLVIVIMATRPG